MSNIEFARDPTKARTNVAKHGISFEEARTVFFDDHARLIDDPSHSDEEQRFLLLGYSLRSNCLIVSHCYREADNVIRLISARRAAAREEITYWSFQ